MQSKDDILREFTLFSVPTGGIESWLTEKTHDDVLSRLGRVDDEPLSAVQLNQLLVLGHEAPVGDGFFRYYWLQAPDQRCSERPATFGQSFLSRTRPTPRLWG